MNAHLKRRNVRIQSMFHSPALSSASLFFISLAEDCWNFPGRTRIKLAGLLWTKLSCCVAGCHASVPTVVWGVSVDRGSSTRWDTSQLPHAWSFPSTDLHLDEEAENWWDHHGTPQHTHSKMTASLVEYLFSIKEQALLWELTVNATGTAFTWQVM